MDINNLLETKWKPNVWASIFHCEASCFFPTIHTDVEKYSSLYSTLPDPSFLFRKKRCDSPFTSAVAANTSFSDFHSLQTPNLCSFSLKTSQLLWKWMDELMGISDDCQLRLALPPRASLAFVESLTLPLVSMMPTLEQIYWWLNLGFMWGDYWVLWCGFVIQVQEVVISADVRCKECRKRITAVISRMNGEFNLGFQECENCVCG